MWFDPFSIREFLKELFSEYIGLILLFIILIGSVCWMAYNDFAGKEEMQGTNMQLAVRMPEHLISMLDEHVDGIRYRSRAQLITIIVDDWLTKKECLNMANLMPRCEMCVFARKRSAESQWECRVRSPRIVPETGDEEAAHWYGVWPVVNPDDWCGKFRKSIPPRQEDMSYELIPSKTQKGAFTMVPCLIVK